MQTLQSAFQTKATANTAVLFCVCGTREHSSSGISEGSDSSLSYFCGQPWDIAHKSKVTKDKNFKARKTWNMSASWDAQFTANLACVWLLQLWAAAGHRPVLWDNETLSAADCNDISQSYLTYHTVSSGSQDPVVFSGTVCMLSKELLLILAEPSTNFSELILKWWHIYPIPTQLQSILGRKDFKDFQPSPWHKKDDGMRWSLRPLPTETIPWFSWHWMNCLSF